LYDVLFKILYVIRKIIIDRHKEHGYYMNMAIEVKLDLMLVTRKMKLTELSEKIGISVTNLSLLKTGRVKGMRFSTLEAICRELDCQPGDILEYVPDYI
jgi:putative transcriptional regulator